MKKDIIRIINSIIFILCFLFILSSFFKIVSITGLSHQVYNNNMMLISVWSVGIILAIIGTRPLYQWILQLRQLRLK